MNPKRPQLLQTLIPYMMVGIICAFFIALLIVFYHVLVWGLLIGVMLWIAAAIRRFLFPIVKADKAGGRIIEHDDKK